MMVAKQRIRMANEKHSKNITQRGNVAKTLVSRRRQRRATSPPGRRSGGGGGDGGCGCLTGPSGAGAGTGPLSGAGAGGLRCLPQT